MRRGLALLAIAGSLGSSWAGCTAPGAVGAVRPRAATAGQALGDQDNLCRDVSQGARPLVVDWKPEERGDLEVAMRQGMAVVAYDCKRLELLSDCRIDGSYGFKGVVLKQQLIRLVDADEIKANLPLSGAALAAQLEGELGRGTTLDLATALVGNLTASRSNVSKAELAGQCQGATHFVRGANVGAFVMETGERAQARTAATLFGAGVQAGSTSSKLARTEDGSLDACKKSSTESPKPPGNCAALVRVHLLPISAETRSIAKTPAAAQDAGPPPGAPPAQEASCPFGLVWQEGKCAKPKVEAPHECRGDDPAECETECNRNQPASCARLGVLTSRGVGGAAADLVKAASLYQKACELEHGGACADLGILYTSGQGVPRDPSRAALLFEQACRLGEASGCFNLGNLYYAGQGVVGDKRHAFSFFEQACNAGKPAGCINAGNMYDDGETVERDSAKAFALFKRACEGEAAAGCTNLAYMYAEGKGTAADQAVAVRLYEQGCALGSGQGCEYGGTRYARGEGAPKDLDKAKALLKRGCDLGWAAACAGFESLPAR